MFPTKAVRIWQVLNDEQRGELVCAYFRAANGYEAPEVYDPSPPPGLSDPL
jgi:hypothetical protein